MRIEIYKLRRAGDEWVIDERHPVAVVTVKDDQRSFHFYDKTREEFLRRLFNEPASAFVGGGKMPDGACSGLMGRNGMKNRTHQLSVSIGITTPAFHGGPLIAPDSTGCQITATASNQVLQVGDGMDIVKEVMYDESC